MTQSTSPNGGFDAHNKTNRKAAFLARMDKRMPWAALVDLIKPHYPKAGNGRPPRSLATMLCMDCVASWFNLADEACCKTVKSKSIKPRSFVRGGVFSAS